MEIVSIIGPIGAGKSTFVNHLKAYDQFDHYYHEDVTGNKWLKAEPTLENKIKCQEYIINHKTEFYKHVNEEDKILEDASLYQDLFYVYDNFYKQNPKEFDLIINKYINLIEKIYHQTDKHTIVFIDLDPEQNLANVKNRGRDFEQALDLEFFKRQNKVLLDILKQFSDKFDIKIYQPEKEMFTCDDEERIFKYEQIFKDLDLI